MDDAAESLSIPAQTFYGKLRGRATRLRQSSDVFLGVALAAGTRFVIEQAQRLILVSLYRYNTRLAGYYDARADALLLLHAEESNVKGMPFGDKTNRA